MSDIDIAAMRRIYKIAKVAKPVGKDIAALCDEVERLTVQRDAALAEIASGPLEYGLATVLDRVRHALGADE